MKVIGFIGSPRNDGNTAWAVEEILKGAEETGAETETWYSGDLDLRPCSGCLGCAKTGECVIDDDMQKIHTSFREADALVLGSPVYMGQMSAQTKIFADRLSALVSPRFSPRFKEENAGKMMIMVFTQGNPDPSKFKTYYDYTESMFRILEFDVRDVIVIAGTRDRQTDEMKLNDSMRKAGSALVTE